MVMARLWRPSLAAPGVTILTAAAGTAVMLLMEPTSIGVTMSLLFALLLWLTVYRTHMLAISLMGQK